MKIKLVSYLDRKCADKAVFINEFSNELNSFFETKHYGDSLYEIYFGIMVLSEMFKELSKPRKPKYTKSKKIFEYQKEFDFEQFQNSDNKALRILILEGIVESLQVISEKVKDFNIMAFEKDLKQLTK
jgi:hypothetical protein